jgi:hypothetical protein
MLVPMVAVSCVPMSAVDVIQVIAVLHPHVSTIDPVSVGMIQVCDVIHAGLSRRAVWASADEYHLVAIDCKSGVALDTCGRILDDAIANLRDPATGLAADMLVVVPAHLVARRTVAEL